jgi:hypothetical protein
VLSFTTSTRMSVQQLWQQHGILDSD